MIEDCVVCLSLIVLWQFYWVRLVSFKVKVQISIFYKTHARLLQKNNNKQFLCFFYLHFYSLKLMLFLVFTKQKKIASRPRIYEQIVKIFENKYLRKENIRFTSTCMKLKFNNAFCLPVCLSVCLFVCLWIDKEIYAHKFVNRNQSH